MSIEVKPLSPEDAPLWDAYVHAHSQATLYHLSGWQKVIQKTYGHDTYYLMAIKDDTYLNSSRIRENDENHEKLSVMSYEPDGVSNPIVGILPLVHLKHFIFGNTLISIPFFDLGGILADEEEVEKALLSEAIKLCKDLNIDNIELRHTQPISFLNSREPSSVSISNELTSMSNEFFPFSLELSAVSCTYKVLTHKARMLLELSESSEALMKSFNSKLRSQIKKPIKEGLRSKIGFMELVDDFFDVFLVNMRDLGSPVHSKKIFQQVLDAFPDDAKIVVVYKDGDKPLAGSIIIGFNDTLENPWASALRKYSGLSPNMLLYWTMIEYACDNSFTHFDFGRSSPDEGTFRFKKQWGAEPSSLYWYYFSSTDRLPNENESEKSRFDNAIKYWKKLPVPVTRIIGPMIRKHIGL